METRRECFYKVLAEEKGSGGANEWIQKSKHKQSHKCLFLCTVITTVWAEFQILRSSDSANKWRITAAAWSASILAPFLTQEWIERKTESKEGELLRWRWLDFDSAHFVLQPQNTRVINHSDGGAISPSTSWLISHIWCNIAYFKQSPSACGLHHTERLERCTKTSHGSFKKLDITYCKVIFMQTRF